MTLEPAASRHCFPEWVATEMARLIQARQSARTPEERAQYELQLAIVCDVAHRYGRALAETSEI